MSKLVKISSFCETNSGGTPLRDKADIYYGGDIPWVKSGELRENFITDTEEKITALALQESAAKLNPANSILLAMYGATVGRMAVLGVEAATNQAICAINPDPKKADLRYVFHALQRQVPEFLLRAKGGAQPNISQGMIRDTEIHLPPLEEQKRIAAILDKADSLRAKRREVLALLDSLAQSIFVEMFESKHSEQWDMTTVGDVVRPDGGMRTGPFGSQLLHSEFVESGIAVLGIDNAVSNEFRWGERRYITESKYTELKRYTVKPGDVIITIMGTCGRCAVIPENIPLAINTKHLCCVRLDTKKCLPHFLHAFFLQHSAARKYLAQKAKGAIMSGLNMSIIKEMPIPLVPLSLQHKYVELQHEIHKLKIEHRSALAELDRLFSSLQHRAFSEVL